MAEFDSITQLPDMSVLEYSAKFHSLGKYSPTIMGDLQLKMHKFTKGLKSRIQSTLAVFEARNFDELLGASIRAEANIKRRDEENKLKRPETGMNLGQGSRMTTNAPQGNKRPQQQRPNQGIQSKECEHCHRVHNGECRWKTGACFRCGQVGHKVTECKVPENELTKVFMPRTNGARQNGNARVYSMTEQEADNAEDVVTGTLLINNLPAFVLFDSGATHSFLSTSFTKLMNREAEHLEEPYRVSTPGNKVLIIYKDYSIEIKKRKT
ncbi:hypothetical protein BUALT_Bualt14G0089100 [Buddleja alternifolia]|uniref:CCHC-type domain-containing protein n=1 Tax=Buddleja alternifolia TaxID=168488 RepID=A0AAV6WP28_9LAMI|nr:hypothetical protein BUALT_Bualt14G0089100 [Buddleja alternifolia]